MQCCRVVYIKYTTLLQRLKNFFAYRWRMLHFGKKCSTFFTKTYVGIGKSWIVHDINIEGKPVGPVKIKYFTGWCCF